MAPISTEFGAGPIDAGLGQLDVGDRSSDGVARDRGVVTDCGQAGGVDYLDREGLRIL